MDEQKLDQIATKLDRILKLLEWQKERQLDLDETTALTLLTTLHREGRPSRFERVDEDGHHIFLGPDDLISIHDLFKAK